MQDRGSDCSCEARHFIFSHDSQNVKVLTGTGTFALHYVMTKLAFTFIAPLKLPP